MRKHLFISFAFLFITVFVLGQEKVISRKQFFKDDTPVEVTLTTDIKKLQGQKKKPTLQPASLTWQNADSSGAVTDQVRVRLRGNNRRENCTLASLMVDFRLEDSTAKSRMKNLKEMKWVAPCSRGLDNEQLVFKEYLIYKMYNLLTEKSYKVRLLKLTFADANGKAKPYTNYAFAIEHTDDLVKRNSCVEEKERQILTEQTNRHQTTLVALFQYMIGNTDWSVPNYHNVKLLLPKDTLNARPYLVPYDFDYAGAVNAPYAVPYETLGIEKVTDRLYQGFPRTMEELKATLEIFKTNQKQILSLVSESPYLNNHHKKEMGYFIEGFFKEISNDADIKRLFVDNARKR